MVKVLIYSLAVFIGIFGMGQLNVLADDSQTNESSSESVKDTDSTPQSWGDNATWYVKDNVLYLSGTEIPDYYKNYEGMVTSVLPWWEEFHDVITKIVINPKTGQKLKLPSDSTGLFSGLSALKEIDGLGKLDVSNVTIFYAMFAEDTSITSLDLSSFQVTDEKLNLESMFSGDNNLQTLDISPFRNSDCLSIFGGDLEKLYQIRMSDLNLEESGLKSISKWMNTSSKGNNDSEDYPQPTENISTWNLQVPDGLPDAFFVGFTNQNIKLNSDQITSYDIDQTQDKDNQNTFYPLVFSVSSDKIKYFGQSIDIDVPKVEGYTSPEKLKVTVFIPDGSAIQNYLWSLNDGEFSSDIVMLKPTSTNKTFTSTIDEDGESIPETFNYSIYYTKDAPTVKPSVPSTSTTPPTVTSKYIHKLQTLTAYPDRSAANIYDEDGNLSKTVALSPDSNWQTDEYMTIKGEKYYRVATNEFVKASDIYLYTPKYSVVRTHDGADYISLDNSHGDTVTNRALAVKTDWKIDKVIKINNEDYYRVATNEFVKADNVDVIR